MVVGQRREGREGEREGGRRERGGEREGEEGREGGWRESQRCKLA